VTLTIHPKHGTKVRRRVHVVFTPSHGRRQTLTIALRA
jgi:hypothetical protein